MGAALPEMIRAVLFDKDGTLFDFFDTWLPAMEAAALETAGGDAALARHLLVIGGQDPVTGHLNPQSALAAGTNLQIAELWAAAVGRSDAPSLAQRFNDDFRAHGVTHAKPVTDLRQLFARLKRRGLKLGLATMDSHAAAEATMAAFELSALLDFVCGYDTGHGTKPGPGMVHAFCRAVGVPVEAVAVVGDTQHDLDMARAAGAGLAIGVLTGASPRERLAPQADHVLESIAEIETVLGQP